MSFYIYNWKDSESSEQKPRLNHLVVNPGTSLESFFFISVLLRNN